MHRGDVPGQREQVTPPRICHQQLHDAVECTSLDSSTEIGQPRSGDDVRRRDTRIFDFQIEAVILSQRSPPHSSTTSLVDGTVCPVKLTESYSHYATVCQWLLRMVLHAMVNSSPRLRVAPVGNAARGARDPALTRVEKRKGRPSLPAGGHRLCIERKADLARPRHVFGGQMTREIAIADRDRVDDLRMLREDGFASTRRVESGARRMR